MSCIYGLQEVFFGFSKILRVIRSEVVGHLSLDRSEAVFVRRDVRVAASGLNVACSLQDLPIERSLDVSRLFLLELGAGVRMRP